MIVRMGVLQRACVTALRFVAVAAAMFAAACRGAERKPDYPPYPDVWEWFVPVDAGLRLKDLSAELLASAEVLVTATFADSGGTHTRKSWLLFAGRTVDEAAIRASPGPTARHCWSTLVRD